MEGCNYCQNEYCNHECQCRMCHACDTCSKCLNCSCLNHNKTALDECMCNSQADCDCEICINTSKCPNYLFCKTKLPQELLDCFGGRCSECDITIGKDCVFIHTNKECNICTDNKPIHVKGTQCDHTVCTDCFSIMIKSSDCNPFTLSVCNSVNVNRCPFCRSGKGLPDWMP